MSGNIIGLYGASNSAVTIAATNTTGLYTGGGTVTIASGGSTYGDANVAALLLTYTGNIQAGNLTVLYDANVGAIYTDNYYYANGSPFAGGGNSTYGNANVVTLLAGFGSNVVTTTGNITGGYFIGNGSQLTGLPASYSDANVVTLLASFGSNTISTTGNVTVGNLTVGASKIISAGNNKITNVTDPVANSDAATKSYVDSSSSAVGFIIADDTANTTTVSSGDTLTLNGTANEVTVAITGTDTVTFGLPDSIAITGNVTAGNLVSNGAVIATTSIQVLGAPGNITNVNYVVANYFVGNGSYLSNIAAGNIVGNVAYADAAGTAVFVTGAAQSNITSVGTLTSLTVTGNIGAGNIATTGNVTIAGNLFRDDITSTGVTVYGDTIITGNLTVQGNTTTINSNVITTNDKTITVANNQSTGANVDGAGFEAGNPAIATWLYNDLTTSWQSNINVMPASNVTLNLGGVSNRWDTVYTHSVAASGNVIALGNVIAVGNISGAYILGNGSQLTGLPESYGNANVSNFLANGFGSNTITTTGNITSGNGNITNTLYVSNITGAAGQTVTITAEGTNDIHLDADSVRIGDNNTDATVVTHGTGNLILRTHEGDANQGNIIIVNGANGNIQLNPNGTGQVTTTRITASGNITAGNVAASIGTFSTVAGTLSTAAQTNITQVGTLNYLTVAATGNLAAGNITAFPGNVSGAYILGNGSQLTGLPATYSDANVVTLLASFGSNTISTTGNVTTGNVSGNIGTFTTVAVSGNITTGNILTNGYYYANGTPVTFGGSLSGNLAGNLLANGFALTSTGNGNVIITANGTGVVNSSKQKMLTFAETVYAYGNTGAATITPDLNLGSIQTMTLTGNITFSTIANITTGGSGTFILTQDATGNRLLTSTMKYAGGFKTLSTTANTADIITVFYDGANYWASLSRGYA